jgi:[ribosomal protein S5]-alanine N-acetyltransferase
MMSPDIVIRRAEESDSDFAYQTIERTMKGYALGLWGKWLESEAREHATSDARSGRSQIIELGSERVGVLCVDRLATHHQLDQLYIVPEHQRQGIGAHVLRLVLSEAQAAGLPVRLRVLRNNPAKGFYERYGFSVVSEAPERFFMERALSLPETPILETARLVLRPLRLEDAPAIQRHFAHWEVVRWLDGRLPWPYPDNGAETYVRTSLEAREQAKRFFWAICLKDAPDDLVGLIELLPDDGSHDQRGFWIAAEFQGRGLMTEAADRVTEYAFLQLGWPQLWLTNAEGNVASSRIKRRQGAQLVRKMEKKYVSGISSGEVWLLRSEDWKREFAQHAIHHAPGRRNPGGG